MFFTLAVSAASPRLCAELADRARVADPAVMPIPGPAVVDWRSPDGRAALLHWGAPPGGPLDADEPGSAGERGSEGVMVTSRAGTIWAESPTPGSGRAPVVARTSVTRVDTVYVAQVPGAVIVADRAIWAAWTASRLDAHDPLHVAALLNPGFPLGSATPFSGVSALTRSTTLHLLTRDPSLPPHPGRPGGGRRAGRGRRAPGRRRSAGRAQPDRRQGQPPDRGRAGRGRGASGGADARVRRSPGRRGGGRDRTQARHRAPRQNPGRARPAGRCDRPDPGDGARRRRHAVGVRERRQARPGPFLGHHRRRPRRRAAARRLRRDRGRSPGRGGRAARRPGTGPPVRAVGRAA